MLLVLACEGSEMKGYMRKQANSKTIRKHMLNGGMNSFNFHSSPRMVSFFGLIHFDFFSPYCIILFLDLPFLNFVFCVV